MPRHVRLWPVPGALWWVSLGCGGEEGGGGVNSQRVSQAVVRPGGPPLLWLLEHEINRCGERQSARAAPDPLARDKGQISETDRHRCRSSDVEQRLLRPG